MSVLLWRKKMHFTNRCNSTAWLMSFRLIHPLGKSDSNCFKITTPTEFFLCSKASIFGKRLVFTEERILPLGSYWFSHYFNLNLAKLSHFWNPSHKMFNLNSSLASQGKFGGVLYSQRSLDTSQTLSVKRCQLYQHINKSLTRNSCLLKFCLFTSLSFFFFFFFFQISFVFTKHFLF